MAWAYLFNGVYLDLSMVETPFKEWLNQGYSVQPQGGGTCVAQVSSRVWHMGVAGCGHIFNGLYLWIYAW